ncbi:Regulatory subunit of type II PKA R-subunit [Popillia japonica]|uniref:Regulatory subunit of type II PKA R-subunit n=1 Tax=Popillia japonica TaxID=7064 RepID=A0AAW1KFG7_POPJA
MNTEEQKHYTKQRDEAPQELRNNLIDFVVELLAHKPEDTIDFAADYFELLKDVRDMQMDKVKRNKEHRAPDVVFLDSATYSIASATTVQSKFAIKSRSAYIRRKKKVKILRLLSVDRKRKTLRAETPTDAFLTESTVAVRKNN